MISRFIQHFVAEELVWESYVVILASLVDNY